MTRTETSKKATTGSEQKTYLPAKDALEEANLNFGEHLRTHSLEPAQIEQDMAFPEAGASDLVEQIKDEKFLNGSLEHIQMVIERHGDIFSMPLKECIAGDTPFSWAVFATVSIKHGDVVEMTEAQREQIKYLVELWESHGISKDTITNLRANNLESQTTLAKMIQIDILNWVQLNYKTSPRSVSLFTSNMTHKCSTQGIEFPDPQFPEYLLSCEGHLTPQGLSALNQIIRSSERSHRETSYRTARARGSSPAFVTKTSLEVQTYNTSLTAKALCKHIGASREEVATIPTGKRTTRSCEYEADLQQTAEYLCSRNEIDSIYLDALHWYCRDVASYLIQDRSEQSSQLYKIAADIREIKTRFELLNRDRTD